MILGIFSVNNLQHKIRLISAFVVFILIMILAPRHEGPHYINGIRFSNKGGDSPMELWAIGFLFIGPVITFLLLTLVFRTINRRRKSGEYL